MAADKLETIRAPDSTSHIEVRNISIGYGSFVVMKDINFAVGRKEIFIIMGGSGSGKSTLLRTLLGLLEPAAGEVLYNGESFTRADPDQRLRMLRRFGVTYQSGALWSSMTLAENVALPLSEYTNLSPAEIREVASLKLAMVGLKGFEDFYPAQISGGMQKRAGLARAIALDPEVLFFDEPSAGLDPITSRRLDDLILELRDSLGSTVMVVTHELASIFAIGDDSVLLDGESRTPIAYGNPRQLRDHSADPRVRSFLTRGEPPAGSVQDRG
ncbi:MAG TPA: ATP-binding cassette domain-containing protein [Candidatus Binataceae bacterium]|nr:ATP-binding cassette domain-containing protein [Candidatus Binataceae bacterium]